ncbi:MAG: hypothetical protein Tsb0014_31880 [Pleurocapsa sp.]
MPAEKAGTETRKNPIRFKNLLREATNKIEQLNKFTTEIEKSLASAQSYLENYNFWQHQDCGLAFFIAPEGIQYYRLPHSFEESVEVSDRFYLKPLLPVITNNSKFYLLALAQNQIKFFLGSYYSISEVDLPESVPVSLADALKYEEPEKQIQYHSGNPGNSPIYHGQGVGTTDNKNEIRRFFQQINSGLQEILSEENAPLILAGVEYLLPIYHEVNSYSNLLETGITGNPENVAPSELHQQAWAILTTHLTATKQQAMNRYHQLSSTGEASSQVEKIVAAAINGQVDTLFIAANNQYWGQFQPKTNKVEIHSQVTEESMDLLDFAATQTYLQGGDVYILEPEEMPDDKNLLAIFRYPVYAQAR